MKMTVSLLMVIVGCLLCVFGLQLMHFFYEFPVIPNILTVTFWRDAVACAVIAVAGFTMMVIGIVRLVHSVRRSK